MALDSRLLKEFSKATTKQEKRREASYTYGVVSIEDDGTYVTLDGSSVKTRATSMVDVRTNDRVAVMFKNHSATITGNLSRPTSDSMTAHSVTVLPEKTPSMQDVMVVVNGDTKYQVSIDALGDLIGGTRDYKDLINKPSIETVELEDDKTFEDLNLSRITNTELENMLIP